MLSLYILIIVFSIVLWFLLSGFYKPIGRYVSRIINDSISEMKDEDEVKGDKNE
jgi:hypothetical protein